MSNSTPHKDRDQQTEPAWLAEEREHGRIWRWIKKASDWIKAKSKKYGDKAEWALGRRTARALEGVALFGVAVALLLVFLYWFIAPTEPKERQGLALVLAMSLELARIGM
jgi:ferric-dicitrate binding protein FerR (iron transport regulator)